MIYVKRLGLQIRGELGTMRAYRCQMTSFWSLIMLEGKFEGDAGCGQSLFAGGI